MMGWMSKFTLLAGPAGGCGGRPAKEWIGKTGRRQRLIGTPAPGGERRLLFGAGPAEAIAGAKQEGMGVKKRQFVKKFVSEQWILSCKSLGRPLVSHL
jgi:hypothetical protein